MPRPVSDNPASAIIHFRLKPVDKAKIVRAAKQAKLTLSAYILHKLLVDRR